MEWCFPQRIFLGRAVNYGIVMWFVKMVRKYYLYFPLKDQNDIFRIGVAVSDKPYGPFCSGSKPDERKLQH